MGDAGSSDDPLGSKSEKRDVETKIHSNSTPEKLILGLTIFETKRKISETFNNLEVRFLRLYKGHDFFILSVTILDIMSLCLRNILDILNWLSMFQVKSVSLSTTQTDILVVPYPTVCPITRLPAFYALVERFIILLHRVYLLFEIKLMVNCLGRGMPLSDWNWLHSMEKFSCRRISRQR